MTDEEVSAKYFNTWGSKWRYSGFPDDEDNTIWKSVLHSVPLNELIQLVRFREYSDELLAKNELKSRDDIPQELKLEVLLLVGDYLL